MASSMPEDLENNTASASDQHKKMTLEAIQWAQQYYAKVAALDPYHPATVVLSEFDIDIRAFDPDRARLVAQLMQILNLVSTRAWHQMETLLGGDLQHSLFSRNQIKHSILIEEITKLYRHALEAFAEYEPPSRLSVSLGRTIMQIRQKYTQLNPLFLAVLGMQLHYTGKMLMEWMTTPQRRIFFLYFKTLEDHLCAPLGQVYRLAADSPPHAQSLVAVQKLLSLSTTIAHRVYQRTHHLYPHSRTCSGGFNNMLSLNSSTRDIELFQIYFCWCALEQSLRPIQQELFPVCVMLYPRLQINWKFVQNALSCLSEELEGHLSADHFAIFYPYIRIVLEIFSDQVVTDQVKV